MSHTEISLGSSPVSLQGYPTKDSDANGDWTHVERYWVKDDAVYNSLPAHNATTNQDGDTVIDPDGNTLKCRSRRIEAGPSPGVYVVELTYAESSKSLTLKSPADNPRQVRMMSEDIPIDDERLLTGNGGPFSQAQIDAGKEAGTKALPLFQVEYTYTEVDASFTWSEANIIASLQDTGSPTGISSATASNWQLMGREIEETEEETIIKTHYRYSGAAFVPIST
jgi:hypothetical protein